MTQYVQESSYIRANMKKQSSFFLVKKIHQWHFVLKLQKIQWPEKVELVPDAVQFHGYSGKRLTMCVFP